MSDIMVAVSDWRQLAEARRQALEAALDGMPPHDRRIVEEAAESLRRNVRRRYPKGNFGRLTALEIVAAVGLLLDSIAEDGDGLPERG